MAGAVAGARLQLAEQVERRQLRAEQRQQRLDQRGVDDLAAAGLLARPKRRHDRERGRERGDAVGECERRQQRVAVRLAVEDGEAAHRLGERAEPGPAGVRARLPEAAHAREHEPGIDRRQLLPADAPALERAGAEVLEHDVGALGQPQEEVGACRLGEVERDEPLVPRERLEPEPDAVLARPVAARGIDAGRVLDLDHVGAVVAEQHRRERSREEGRRLDDLDPPERRRRLVRDLAHGRSTASRKPIHGERAIPAPRSSSLSE